MEFDRILKILLSAGTMSLLSACCLLPQDEPEEEAELDVGVEIVTMSEEEFKAQAKSDNVKNTVPAAKKPPVPKKLAVIDHPSPNYSERTLPVNTIVLHYTAGDTKGSLSHLCNAKAKDPVSAHYVVDLDGTIYRLVDESKRAWHAGVGTWQGRGDVNSSSVGIEIVNLGHDSNGKRITYPWRQITAVIDLCKDIMSRHKIEWVIGHSDMGLGRKDDPGEHFPWRRLARAGVGIWTDSYLQPTLPAAVMLRDIGYETTDLHLATAAFQMHFYPQAITSGGKRTNERLAAVHALVTAKSRGNQ